MNNSATVGLSDVASANIVGYAGSTMSNGFRSVAAQFTTVGSVAKGFWLSSAVVNGAEQHTSSKNQVSLQTLKPDGTMDISYTYHKGDTSRDFKSFDGWYLVSKPIKPDTASDVFFPVGTGLWLKGTDQFSFQTAGEVIMDSMQCDLTNGFKMVANPYPVAIKLSSIEILGADQHTSSKNQVSLQTLKTDGTMDISYTYHKGDTSRDFKSFDGWYLVSKPVKPDTATEVLIPAGAAVWVKSTSDEFDIVIPSPFEEAE